MLIKARSKKRGIFFLLLYVLFFLPSIGSQTVLSWEPVAGALRYHLEIRHDENLVLEIQSKESHWELHLNPGEYRYRVGSINSFGKVEGVSDWKTLSIRAHKNPFLFSISPSNAPLNSQETFLIQALGWQDNSVFIFENPQGKQVLAQSWRDHQGRILLKPQEALRQSGLWDLVMQNSPRKENRLEGALSIVKPPKIKPMRRKKPRIIWLKPRFIQVGQAHNLIRIKVEKMEEDAVLTLEGPSRIELNPLGKDEAGIRYFDLDLSQALASWYSLKISHPSSGKSDRKEAILLLNPAPAKEALLSPKLESEAYPYHFFSGWRMRIPLGKARNDYSTKPYGIALGFLFPLQRKKFQPSIPLLQDMRWELSYAWIPFESSIPTKQGSFSQQALHFGLHYRKVFSFPINLIARLGTGLEWDTGENLVHFSTYMGIGGRFEIHPRWYLEIAHDFSLFFYAQSNVFYSQPRLEWGFRW